MTQSTITQIDPITLATIWHSYQSLCREMRYNIERTAQSYLMAYLKDVSVGVWLADGSCVAMPEGLPTQFMGTKFAIQAVKEKFGDDLHPGDVILTNDPYHGGHTVHLPDWGFIRPIFCGDELVFFTLVRGHQMDTGGSFPGGYFPNGYDIHAEGLCIPLIKVFDRGQERSDVLELIWNNVRFREAVRVDNYAMIATTTFAENRVLELTGRYGKDVVLACIREMFDRTERAIRAEIAAIPDGTYTGEAATDDDGTELDKPVWVRVDVTIAGEEMTIDFSRSDRQRKGFVNCIYATTYGVAIAVAAMAMDPALADYHNEGTMRPIKVIAPLGTVVNCEYPATVGASPLNMGVQIAEAVTQALAKAQPKHALAAWNKHRGDYSSGVDPRSNRPYVRTTFDYDGSAGAVYGYDGATGPTTMGASVVRGNVEEAEVRYPWRMEKLEIVPDFMGAGRWRGGGGIDWRAVNEGSDGHMATGSSDGDEMLGKGVLGGDPSPQCRTYLQRNGELTRVKPHRMALFKTGDTLIKLSAGGAGVGSPREREVSAVVRDVSNGLVTLEAARLIYGVAIDPGTLKVDEAETARLRAQVPYPEHEIVVNSEKLGVEIRPVQDPGIRRS